MSENMKKPAAIVADQKLLCGNLSFAGSEAYKRLRANLLLSFPDEQKCRVIGVTSANRGEGKSITAINLAYTFAETGKKTLLVEADMRLPNLAARMDIQEAPGLSNLLVNLSKVEDVLQSTGVQENLHMLTAGDIPPNPSELLGSERMKTCLQNFGETYDYIVLDLPPVNIVSDALEIARMVDGFVFVVRQEYSTRASVMQAMSQMQMVDAKILGFVMNHSSGRGKKGLGRYYRKYGYYRYYRRYGKRKKLQLPVEENDD